MKKLIILPALALVLSACSTTANPDNDKIHVMASMYPAKFLAEKVGGDLVSVSTVTPPGADPHEAELTPKRTQDLIEADVVLWFSGMQPAVDSTLEKSERNSNVTIDLAELAIEHPEHDHDVDHNDDPDANDHGSDDELADSHTHHDHDADDHADDDHGHSHDHGGIDPHVWLNPQMMIAGTQEVRDALIAAAPDHEEIFTKNAEALSTELQLLYDDFNSGLARCEHRTIISGHEAFGHLAEAFHLEQVAVLGLSSHGEPSASDLARIAATVKNEGVSTIFTEHALGDDMTKTLARETGAEILVLDPLELAPQGSNDYISVMRTNLDNLRTALECQ